MQKKVTNDPANYSQMSVPFESEDEANKAMNDFYEEVGELRKKYKIQDLLVVMYGSLKSSDGEVGNFMNSISFGSSLNQEGLAAYAYGAAKADREDRIMKLLSGKPK
jgi:hypothetical protein